MLNIIIIDQSVPYLPNSDKYVWETLSFGDWIG